MKPYRIKTTSPEFRALDDCTKKLAKLYGAKKYGENICFTCRKKRNSVQAGHFCDKKKLIYRWNLNNIRPQCVWCNKERACSEMLFTFEERLWEEVGKDEVDRMKKIYLGLSNEKFKVSLTHDVIVVMLYICNKLFEELKMKMPRGINILKKYPIHVDEMDYANMLLGYTWGQGKESP